MQPIELARRALEEDRYEFDRTSTSVYNFLEISDRSLAEREFFLFAKSNGVFCGEAWIEAISEISKIPITMEIMDGDLLTRGRRICRGRGSALRILSIERTLLNEIQHLCGVATQTKEYVSAVLVEWKRLGLPAGQAPGVYHTRKTIPLHRKMQMMAVVAGGGQSHRKDLQERILVKENHKYLIQDLGLSFKDYLEFLKSCGSLKDALIEVESKAEAMLAKKAGCLHLLLDNFSPDQVLDTIEALGRGIEIEISGGLNLKSIAQYVIPGVSRLSVGALTHSVQAIDISLDWTPL